MKHDPIEELRKNWDRHYSENERLDKNIHLAILTILIIGFLILGAGILYLIMQ